jgi:hypothetical protein
VGRQERQVEAGFTYLVVQEQSGATFWAGRRGRWRQGSHTWWYRSSQGQRCGQAGEAGGGRAHTPVPGGLASFLPNQQAYINETKREGMKDGRMVPLNFKIFSSQKRGGLRGVPFEPL